MEKLIEVIQQKKESALQDYNRFMQKPNEYQKEALLCRGEYEAYVDIEYYLKTHKVEVR